jgi:uncharacterized protein DUF3306
MSDDDTFIARWSRLKRGAAQGKKPQDRAGGPDEQKSADAMVERTAGAAESRQQQEDESFDPATLPPIESIVADSDIRAFLRSEVPAHLTRAALRRAWTADPAIRDFIGIAENQWDFTDPASIPGFGSLEGTGDMGRLVSQVMGDLREAGEAVARPADAQAGSEGQATGAAVAVDEASAKGLQPSADDDPGPHDDPGRRDVAAAPAAVRDDRPADAGGPAPARRRGHGGALPK